MKILNLCGYGWTIMDPLLIAEIIGFIALTTDIACYQIKRPRVALWAFAIGYAIWIMHFYFLGEMVAVLVGAVGMTRTILAATLPAKYMRVSTTLCIIAAFLIGIPAIKEMTDWLPALGAIAFGSSAFMRERPLSFRTLNFIGEVIWFGYGFIIGSNWLIIAGVFALGSLTISIARHEGPLIKETITNPTKNWFQKLSDLFVVERGPVTE